MGYSLKDCERLVMCADKNGRIIFKDVRKKFPNYGDSFFYGLIGDSFKSNDPLLIAPLRMNKQWDSIMMFWEHCPDDYREGYTFKDTDTFCLSVPGDNLLYQLQKERKQSVLNWVAAIGGAIGGICAILTVFSG